MASLQCLSRNVVIIYPTATEPYHKITMSNGDGCGIFIAATKPFPDPISRSAEGPNGEWYDPNPGDWIQIVHNERCLCTLYSRAERDLFESWQELHQKLRRDPADNASYAFYPEFEYETGEALAHAALIGKLALGKRIPEAYHYLVPKYGSEKIRRALAQDLPLDD